MIPLYFLPKVMLSGLATGGRLNRSLLASRGLAVGLADCETLHDCCRCEIVGQGPDGNPGMIVGAKSAEPPRMLGYYPAEQNWTQLNEGLWIGLDAKFPPTPQDLARAKPTPGHLVTLADGQDYEIPVIRQLDGAPTLPRDMFWNENGAFEMQLQAAYQGLWEKALRVGRLFYEPTAVDFGTIDLEEALALCVEFLGVNYRFGRDEQRALRLVTTANWEKILGAVVDKPRIEAILADQKKTQDSPTPPGGSAETLTTDPA